MYVLTAILAIASVTVFLMVLQCISDAIVFSLNYTLWINHIIKLRHWTRLASVPRVHGQDLYPKCASVHSAVSENLAIHRESY